MGEAATVNQDSILSEHFAGMTDYIDKDGFPVNEAPVEKDQNAQPAKEEKQESVKQVSNVPEPTNKGEQNQEQMQPEDPFNFLLKGDDGSESFNAEGALNFLTKDATGQPREEVKYERPEPPAQQQPQQPEKIEPTYEETLKQNYTTALGYAKQYMAQGYTPEQALMYAEQLAYEDLNKHFNERSRLEWEQRMEQKEASIRKQEQIANMRPQATANLNTLSKNYGGIDKFKNFLFNREYGGDLIMMMFDRENPQHKNLTGEALTKELDKWMVSLSSNMNHLSILEQSARGRLGSKSLPRLVNHVKSLKDRQAQERKLSQVPGVSNLDRPGRNPAQKEPDAVDKYFNPSISRI
jgi:hypothetical protein